MTTLKETLDHFNKQNPSPCWKTPGHEMLLWAQEWERDKSHNDPKGHGMGDLTKPCQPKPGETCPACGITWSR